MRFKILLTILLIHSSCVHFSDANSQEASQPPNHHHVNSSCQTDCSNHLRTQRLSGLSGQSSWSRDVQPLDHRKDDKYGDTTFRKRTLQQFAEDVAFNFAPQIDLRDFSRVLPYQSFPAMPPPAPPRGLRPEDLGDYSEMDPYHRDVQGLPLPPPPDEVAFPHRQPSFQRIRIPASQANPPQPPSQSQPQPPPLLRPQEGDDDNRHSSSPVNDSPRFQRVRMPSTVDEQPDRLERLKRPERPQNFVESSEPVRQPASAQQFRRLPLQRTRQAVREPEERPQRRPVAFNSEERPVPNGGLSVEDNVRENLQPTSRPRRVRPTANENRRIRPVNRNRLNSNRVGPEESPESVIPTAVVVNKPPQTPVASSTDQTQPEIGARLPVRELDSARRPVRVRRPSNQIVSSRRRLSPKLSTQLAATSSRTFVAPSVAADEEVIGNNAVDADVVANGGFGSKIREDAVLTQTVPLASAVPVVVDYLTVFTYLTTVIRGPHTLLTSRESTTSLQVTQPYDSNIADIMSHSSGNLRPSKAVNLGTKTKGPTTTIVNLQSKVQIANVEFISASAKPNQVVLPTRSSNELKRTRKPLIETAPKAANILKVNHLQSIPKTYYTQYTYFYTVYDEAKTRKSTRAEVTTSRVPDSDNLATLNLDTTVNAEGLISIGTGPSTVNLGKRVFGRSTTEVNLAMKTFIKLDGIRNAVVEPSPTKVDAELSHEITIRPSEALQRPTLAPSLDASSPPLIESGLSALPELESQSATPLIVPISSDIRTFKTRRPVRVSSTAVNPENVRSRITNNRVNQRNRQRPNFSRISRPKLASSLESEIPEISPSFLPEYQSVPASSSAFDLPIENPETSATPALVSDIPEVSPSPAYVADSEILDSDAVSASKKRVAVTVRRPYANDRLRSRLRRPQRPQATSEPKYVVVTRSASTESINKSSKSRFRVASRVIRPGYGSSPVETTPAITESDLESRSIVPSSSVVVTYYSTTTHTVPFTMNDKTLLTTFEETNTRVATEPLDSAAANGHGKVTKIADGVTLLLSSNIEPSSPLTLKPTLVTGAAVHMKDGLSVEDQADMETKTVYTTYTYFTTFYSGPSSVISSSEQIVSNLVTLPRTTQIRPTVSLRSPVTVVETSEKIETSTIYSTYTYFATLFNGSRSTITPIEETRSEVLTLREPIRITRTINPTASSMNSLFTRTYYTTYTKATTYTDENNLPKTSRKEQVVSNVVTFTLSGHRETPALDLNRIQTTQTINHFSAFPSLFTTKSTLLTSTHYVTMYSGTHTILSSFEEVTPTVVTHILGQPTAAVDDQRVALSSIESSLPFTSKSSSSRDLMTALVPSISTLHVTHTYYTTFFNGHTSIVSSRTEATSSLVTLYVPLPKGSGASAKSSSTKDQIITVYKSNSADSGLITKYETIQSTPSLSLLRSPTVDIPNRKSSSSISPSMRVDLSTRRIDPQQSSILSKVVENLSSQGLSDDQISSAIFGGQGMGKSTTVIGGSTIVFFTDLILSPTSSVKASISPSKTDHVESGMTIKPGTVIELSDLLGENSNANLAGGLGSAIKDIVHLIASNANKGKLNSSESSPNSDRVELPQGGIVKIRSDQEPVYIPLGGKARSNETVFSETSRVDGSEPVYRPDLGQEESGSSSSSSSSESNESRDTLGYMRKNDIYHRKNHHELEASRRSQPVLASSIISPSADSPSSSYDTPPLSISGSGIYTQVNGGATTIFFTEGLESSFINPTLLASPTSTRFITSVESMTRTLTLTTTKVYYTRDSPLTITSVLTTTIPPRTFVSTIIGSRTILGTAGEATKTVDLESKSGSNDEVTTTVTTTTLIFNSITTTVVRTLVIPTAIQATRTTSPSSRPSRRPYTPFRPPQRSTTPSSVSIRPPGPRTRSPYLAKYKPSTPKPSTSTPSESETIYTKDSETKRVTSTPPKIFDDDQCRPACNAANKEMCREVDGIFRCECRPGFARKDGSSACEAMQSYVLVVRLMKVGESSVSYSSDLSDASSNEFQKLAKLTKQEVNKAYQNSSIKDNFIGVNVNTIKNPSDGDDGVLVNMTVHLANHDGLENEINLDTMQSELSKTLVASESVSESLPDPSSVVADIETLEDFDECSDEKFNDCDPAARCINKPGSYACECKGAYTDMDPNLPGRICAAEIKNCETCHGRGDCVQSEDGEKTTCKCQRMYMGERCEYNGLLIATFLPIAAILSIVSVCCVVYCFQKYRKKSNYPKGFKNLVAYPPQNMGASTLDRKAMLETSSESSEHFRHAGIDASNGMGHYPPGTGSTRRHVHQDMDRALGSGAYVTMPPQVTIPRARHLNQDYDPTFSKSCMRSEPNGGHHFGDDHRCDTLQKRRSQSRSGSRIGSRAESRPDSKCLHHEEDFGVKDFIEWTPKKVAYEKQFDTESDQQSDCKSKSAKGLSDLRIGHFDWQWKMLRQGGSYSPNTRGTKKSITDDRHSFGGAYLESPITSHKRRFHEPKDSNVEASHHNLSLVSERDESVVSFSTAWTGGPAQYHLADDLISLKRRNQVSNWGRLPFYDN